MVSTYQKHGRQMWLLEFPTFFQAILKTYVHNNLSTNYSFYVKKEYSRIQNIVLKTSYIVDKCAKLSSEYFDLTIYDDITVKCLTW